jgi:hypothetical protein
VRATASAAGAPAGRQSLLLAVAVLLSAAALLAIGILLFGDFGETEGQILASTALLGAYGLLALPAAILVDRRRLLALAAAIVALAGLAATLALVGIWGGESAGALGKTMLTANAWLLATVQTAALVVRRSARDPRSVGLLFLASTALAGVLALMVTTLVWAGIDSQAFFRVLGAVVVLDVLLVALQPIVARARPVRVARRVRVALASGETVELEIEAPDLATAAAKAIRGLESRGDGVVGLTLADAAPEPADRTTG